jgi:hypothetical protein
MGPIAKKCKPLAVTPVSFVNVASVAAGVGVGVGVGVGMGAQVEFVAGRAASPPAGDVGHGGHVPPGGDGAPGQAGPGVIVGVGVTVGEPSPPGHVFSGDPDSVQKLHSTSAAT